MTYDGKSWRYETARKFLEAMAYRNMLIERFGTSATIEGRSIAMYLLDGCEEYIGRMAENVDTMFGEGFELYISCLLNVLGEDIDLEQAIKEWEEDNGQRYGD